MGESAVRKRAVLRRLHEQWNVPLSILAELGILKPETLQLLANKQGWKQAHSTASIQSKLIEVLEQHLVRYSCFDEEEGGEEKRARALSVLAKAMESLAAVDVRLSSVQRSNTSGKTKSNRKDTPDEQSFQFDPERTAHLDQQLAELVQNLS